MSVAEPWDPASRRARARGGEPADSPALDVSRLPSIGFGPRSLMWWGTLGLMAIEGTVFALAIATYFYLRGQSTAWPLNEPPPSLQWGTANSILLIASLWPNHLAKRAAERFDRQGVRLWLGVCLLAALVLLVLRGFEFTTLHCRWYEDAYASAVWLLLGLHTTHLVTDTWDTGVLLALAWAGPFESKRHVDVSENAIYWVFVVLSWLPIYAVIYWAPRAV
jgi:cytochrome c oxidase subunit 1/cytochrome c oxidase subunit I+III